MEVMRRLENLYLKRLDEEPADMDARVGLAWCLFAQGLYRAGQESVLTGIAAVGDASIPQAGEAVRILPEKSARLLLKDCLRHALTVEQLSPNAQDQADVEKLQALVKLAGAGCLVLEAEDESDRILAEITREILYGPDAVEKS
ncbi:MAG TPA: hypothetical protein VKT32_04295 [Chthonomonadaceae bacterium]|nr:hypothetical protein [Chthonomonadaceae bacterium]